MFFCGEYYFGGEFVKQLNLDQFVCLCREGFGFVFQSYYLIVNVMVLENVEVFVIYVGFFCQ